MANVSFYFNASQYYVAVKACKNLTSHKQIKKNLIMSQSEVQVLYLIIKLQGIHQICCKTQERLTHTNSIRTNNIMLKQFFSK